MSLPLIQHPTKTVTLPLTKKEVKYRPFLVKEEKILVMLRESEDATPADYLQALGDTIRACAFDAIDPMALPAADVEYLFLKIRALSKGNISKIAYNCKAKIEGTEDVCGHTTEVEVDLDTIEPTYHDGHTKSIAVKGTDLVVHLNYPTLTTMKKIVERTKKSKVTKIDLVEVTLIDCLKMVTQGEQVMTPDSEDDVRAFMEQLGDGFFDEMDDKFMNRTPTLEKTVHFKCAKCGHQEDIHLKGLKDFF